MSKKLLHAAVYGSGVSGLIAAYALLKKGVKVDVIDPFSTPILGSLETDDGVVELAANSILNNKAVEELLSAIELQPIVYSKLGRVKYVFLEGRASKWPLSFWSTLKSFKALFALARQNDKMKPLKKESLQDWGARLLDKDLLENLIKPGLQGVYGFETESLSASLVLKNFFAKKDKPKLRGSVSFQKGMGQFVESLRSYLEKNGVLFLTTAHSTYDFSIVSTPAHSLPDVVSAKNKKLLEKVYYKPISICTFIVDKKDKLDIEGFGCVFKDQEEGALGLILNSDLFPKRSKYGYVSETWIFDGRKISSQYEMEKAVKNIRSKSFKKSMNVKTVYFKHWAKAFPDYNLDLENCLEELDQKKDKVFFFANWTGSLGIGSMIKSSEAFAEKIIDEVSK